MTLPELLVVIAILVVLALLLFPVWRVMTAGAQATACAGHLRQSVFYLLLMAREHDESILTITTAGPGAGPGMWGQRLANLYLDPEERDILFCPAEGPYNYRTASNNDTSSIYRWRTYGIVAVTGQEMQDSIEGYEEEWIRDYAGPGQNSRVTRIHLGRLAEPGRLWLLADSISGMQSNPIQTSRIFSEGSSQIHLRHQGRANVAFADGRVESVGPDGLHRLFPTRRSRCQASLLKY